MNYLGLRSAIRWNLCLSTLDWTNEQLLANCFTITCYSAISLFNISLTSCFYSSFTQIIQENILRIFSILCCKSLMTCLRLFCNLHWHNHCLNNFEWNFSPLLTNHSLQVRKSFWWRASLLIAFFRTIHKFSIVLRSGLCAGHSRDSRQWLFFQDCYFVTLSSCKIVALGLSCLSATSGKKCFCKMRRYFAPVTLPLTMASATTLS